MGNQYPVLDFRQWRLDSVAPVPREYSRAWQLAVWATCLAVGALDIIAAENYPHTVHTTLAKWTNGNHGHGFPFREIDSQLQATAVKA